jgi:hypothetical protein
VRITSHNAHVGSAASNDRRSLASISSRASTLSLGCLVTFRYGC